MTQKETSTNVLTLYDLENKFQNGLFKMYCGNLFGLKYNFGQIEGNFINLTF